MPPSVNDLRRQAVANLGLSTDMQLNPLARSLIDAEVERLQTPTATQGAANDSGGGVGDWLLEASKGFQMATQALPNLVSFAGNLAMDDFNQTAVGQAAAGASNFFDQGLQSATEMQSQGFRDKMAAPIYNEETGQWQAPNATQVVGTVLTALPQIPLYISGAGVAGELAGAARLAPRAYKLAKLAGMGSSAALKLARALPGMASYGVAGGILGGADTYAESYDSVMQKLGEYDIPDAQKDRVASKLATAAGLRQIPVSAVMNAVGLGGAAHTSGALWKRIATGALEEIPSEAIEEGGQGLNANLAVKQLDPQFDIWTGVRTRAAMGAIAGGTMGAGVAALEGHPERQHQLDQLRAELDVSPDAILNGAHPSAQTIAAPDAAAPAVVPDPLATPAATVTPAASPEQSTAVPRLAPPKPGRSPEAQKAWDVAEVSVALAADATDALEKEIPNWSQMDNKAKAKIIDAVIDADGNGTTEKGLLVQKWAEHQAAAIASVQQAHALDDPTYGKPTAAGNELVGGAEASAPVAGSGPAAGQADAGIDAAGGVPGAEAPVPALRTDVLPADATGDLQPALSTAISEASTLETAPARAANPRAVSAERDDLLVAAAKLGGFSREEASSQGIDKDSFKRRAGFGGVVFPKKGGLSFDAMAERLFELGYPVADSRGNYDPNVLLQHLLDALGGKKVRTPMGDAYATQLEQQRRDIAMSRNAALPPSEAGPEFTPSQSAVGALFADALEAGYSYAQLDALLTDQDSLAEIHRKLSTLLLGENQDVQPEGNRDRRRQRDPEEARQEEIPDGAGEDLSDFSDGEVDQLFRGVSAAEIRAARAPENFSLTTHTEDDIRQREARAQDTEAAAADERQRQVDATRDNFTLSTGTATAGPQVRPAVSGGQTDLLATPVRRRGELHTEPSEAQKDAGNYPKEKVKWHGLDLSIETQAGTMRRGTDPNGKDWEVRLNYDYGYVRGTEGADGDHVDVYLGPNLTGDKVFVVNQTHADGSFDEHKVMLGFDSLEAAKEGYLSNYEQGWDRIKDVVEMSADQFKTWLADGDTKKPATAPSAATSEAPDATSGAKADTSRAAGAKGEDAGARSNGERIEDFGEKIGGAKKDLWSSYTTSLKDPLPEDIKDLTLSKHFPEPNYEKMIEAGASVEAMAAIRAMRDQMPAKPRQSWKLRMWADSLVMMREVASNILDGKISMAELRSKLLGSSRDMSKFVDKIDIYAGLGFPAFMKADGADLRWGTHFTYEGDERTDHPNQYGVFFNGRRVVDKFFKEKKDAIAALREYLDAIDASDKAPRETKLDLYRVTATGEVMIGKKIGTNRYIDLKAFESVKEARAYLKENEAELIKQLQKFREDQNNVPTRRSTNDPRRGEDYRKGEDIAPQQFGDAFGFRGVEFGNWVEQGRRKADLNNAYDALMDMAKVIGIPPKAVSLNGSLGLAFGARGHAGAAAHFEPGKVVINLTKKEGAGSLGHEWFHAMDNYFSRQRGKNDDFLTAKPHELKEAGLRPEVIAAFGNLMKTVNSSPMAKRSIALDKKRPKDYWSTPEELGARAFESYLVAKGKQRGEANDYLANLIDPDTAKVVFESGASDWPYPFDGEIDPIVEAFDKLFETIQTKETDKGVAMYKRGEASWYYSPLQRAVEGIKQETAPAAQWAATIAKLPGVKPDELEWTGLTDWLALQSGKVTKAQILEYVAGNGVQVDEVSLGAPQEAAGVARMRDRFQELMDLEDGPRSKRRELTPEEVAERDDLAEKLSAYPNPHLSAKPSKYDQYVLPGGENYRELLLTLPEVKTSKPYEQWLKENFTGIDNAEARRVYAVQQEPGKNYSSSHWEEANILAHIRFNERTDADGKKVLFIEELQSDWAQEGKRKGFAVPPEKTPWPGRIIAKQVDGEWAIFDTVFPGSPIFRDRFSSEAEAKKWYFSQKPHLGSVPSSPFVTKTDAWVALAIKRMVRYAAENGFDRVAFVNGEQSAQRYDLSKHIDRIMYAQEEEGIWSLSAIKGHTEVFSEEEADADRLESLVGKEIASKIINGEGNSIPGGPERELTGLDLKVGGEGMKAFYDKIVPTVAKDVLKKLGGPQLRQVSIDIAGNKNGHGAGFRPEEMQGRPTEVTVNQMSGDYTLVMDGTDITWGSYRSEEQAKAALEKLQKAWDGQNGAQQIGFDITPELREKAAGGMPLFKRNEPAMQLVSKDEAEKSLRQDKFVARLLDAGRIVVHPDGASLPGNGANKDGILGVATPDGVIHLNAGAHDSAAGLVPTLMHEAFHARVQPLIGGKGWGRLMQSLDAMYEKGLQGGGGLDAFFQKAMEQVESEAVGQDKLTRAQKVEELGAYAIDHYESAPRSLRTWVDLLLGKVKAWALNHFGAQLGKVTPAQLRELAKMALRDSRYDAYRAGAQTANSRAVDNPANEVTVAWKMLATDSDLFKLPKSSAGELPGIFAEIDPSIQVSESAQEAKRAQQETGKRVDRAFVLAMPRKRGNDTVYDKVYVYQAGREVWINAASLKEGVSGGFKVYAGVGNYAFNTGRVFIGDPLGLSDAALLRRTEHMLSLALKFGTTSFMMPHQKQVAPASDSLSKLKGKVRPLDWRVGADEHNLVELVRSAYHNILPFAPEVRNVDFDAVSGRFVHAESRKPVTDADWDKYQSEYQRRLVSMGITAPNPGPGGRAGQNPGSAVSGSATLKRAAFAHSFLRRTSSSERRGLLAFLSGKLQGGIDGQAGVENTDLKDVFYRRQSAPAAPPTAGTFDAAKDYAGNLVDQLVYNYQDRFIDLRRLQGKLGKLPESQDASLAETRYSGTVMARTQDFQQSERDPLIKAIHAAKLTYEEVEDYLNAKDAPYRNAAMQEINPTRQELDAKAAGLESSVNQLFALPAVKDFIKTQREVRRYQDEVDEGLADASSLFAPKQRLARLKKDADVMAYIEAKDALKVVRNTKAFDGDNTALSGLSNQEAAAMVAKARKDGKFDALEKISGMVDDITNGTRQVLVDGGLSKQEEIDAWAKKYPHYVPRHREEVGGDSPVVGPGRGFNIRGKESKRATGSQRKVVDILAHIMAQREVAIVRAEKVKVDRALYEMLKANPDPSVATLDTVDKVRMVDETTGTVVDRVDPLYKNRPNVITFKMNGEEHTIAFNDENPELVRLAASLKNMDAQQLGAVTAMVGRFTRFLATMSTTANPVFIARNFLRDLQTAYVNLSDTELAQMKKDVYRDIPKAIRGFWRMADGKMDSEFARFAKEFRDAGGQTGWLEHTQVIGDRAKAMQKQLADMSPGKWSATKQQAAKLWQLVEDANNAVENGIRLSAYANARRSGMSAGKAAELAKNLTVNFNRRGAKSVELNMWYMFMNASIQGTARIAKAASNKEVQKLLGFVVASGFLMDLLARALAGDDDDDGENDYDQLPEYVKASNWVFWVDGKPITIPQPYGYNFVSTAGRKISETLFRKNYSPLTGAADMANAFVGAFSPIGQAGSMLQAAAPTIADPFVQWAENKNFAGNPLYKEQLPYGVPKPEFQMGFRSTSQSSKWLAEMMNNVSGGNEVRPGSVNVNPAMIDFAVSSLIGGAGKSYLQALNLPLKLLSGDDLQAREIPFVNIFGSAQPENQIEGKFFTYLRSVELASREAKEYAGTKDGLEVRQRHKAELSLAARAKMVSASLKLLREREKAVGLTREQQKQIDKRKQDLMAGFNKAYTERVE